MRQADILALLKEASDPSCTSERQNDICCQLRRSFPKIEDDNYYPNYSVEDEERGQELGMRLIAENIFMDTLKHRPELLPTLFPVFALVFGDRDDEDLICADIDWSLVP